MSALLATRGLGRGAQGSLAAFGFTRKSIADSVRYFILDVIVRRAAACIVHR